MPCASWDLGHAVTLYWVADGGPRLGGMTGTAFTEAKEFEEVYKLKTVPCHEIGRKPSASQP